jgi:hypothetical protein
MLAEAEAIIAEATGEAEPPHRGVPDRSGVKAIHRANVVRGRADGGVRGRDDGGVRRKPAQGTLFDA